MRPNGVLSAQGQVPMLCRNGVDRSLLISRAATEQHLAIDLLKGACVSRSRSREHVISMTDRLARTHDEYLLLFVMRCWRQAADRIALGAGGVAVSSAADRQLMINLAAEENAHAIAVLQDASARHVRHLQLAKSAASRFVSAHTECTLPFVFRCWRYHANSMQAGRERQQRAEELKAFSGHADSLLRAQRALQRGLDIQQGWTQVWFETALILLAWIAWSRASAQKLRSSRCCHRNDSAPSSQRSLLAYSGVDADACEKGLPEKGSVVPANLYRNGIAPIELTTLRQRCIALMCGHALLRRAFLAAQLIARWRLACTASRTFASAASASVVRHDAGALVPPPPTTVSRRCDVARLRNEIKLTGRRLAGSVSEFYSQRYLQKSVIHTWARHSSLKRMSQREEVCRVKLRDARAEVMRLARGANASDVLVVALVFASWRQHFLLQSPQLPRPAAPESPSCTKIAYEASLPSAGLPSPRVRDAEFRCQKWLVFACTARDMSLQQRLLAAWRAATYTMATQRKVDALRQICIEKGLRRFRVFPCALHFRAWRKVVLQQHAFNTSVLAAGALRLSRLGCVRARALWAWRCSAVVAGEEGRRECALRNLDPLLVRAWYRRLAFRTVSAWRLQAKHAALVACAVAARTERAVVSDRVADAFARCLSIASLELTLHVWASCCRFALAGVCDTETFRSRKALAFIEQDRTSRLTPTMIRDAWRHLGQAREATRLLRSPSLSVALSASPSRNRVRVDVSDDSEELTRRVPNVLITPPREK